MYNNLIETLVKEEKVLTYLNSHYPLYKDYEWAYSSETEQVTIINPYTNSTLYAENWDYYLFFDTLSAEQFIQDIEPYSRGKLKDHIIEWIYKNIDTPIGAYSKFIIKVIVPVIFQKYFKIHNEFVYVFTDFYLNSQMTSVLRQLENHFDLEFIYDKTTTYLQYRFKDPKSTAGLILLARSVNNVSK